VSLVAQEIEWRLKRLSGWPLLIARNEWFQSAALGRLEALAADAPHRVVLFAHSYSALQPFQFAKARGWTTVLGQIDPGEEHFKIVRRLSDAAPQFGPAPEAPPIEYFENWRHECALADHIVVNSDWSRRSVMRAGVDGARIAVLPLAYQTPDGAAPAPRAYPDRFTPERPLRLLFVGSVSVVKGVPELLEAMMLLRGLPVTLTLVGERSMQVPPRWESLPSVSLTGAVPRGDMTGCYGRSDVLVFPSHSDGFGMAQIEAQAAGLPIIASSHCGTVVADGRTGVILGDVTADTIAAAVRQLLARPATLAEYSRAALSSGAPGLAALGTGLVRMVEA
jgi:glycosyltransferase involved in cell wall biosynthesis